MEIRYKLCPSIWVNHLKLKYGLGIYRSIRVKEVNSVLESSFKWNIYLFHIAFSRGLHKRRDYGIPSIIYLTACRRPNGKPVNQKQTLLYFINKIVWICDRRQSNNSFFSIFLFGKSHQKQKEGYLNQNLSADTNPKQLSILIIWVKPQITWIFTLIKLFNLVSYSVTKRFMIIHVVCMTSEMMFRHFCRTCRHSLKNTLLRLWDNSPVIIHPIKWLKFSIFPWEFNCYNNLP